MYNQGGILGIISATFLATASNVKDFQGFFINLCIYLFCSCKGTVLGYLLGLHKFHVKHEFSEAMNSLVSIRVFINLYLQENKNKGRGSIL